MYPTMDLLPAGKCLSSTGIIPSNGPTNRSVLYDSVFGVSLILPVDNYQVVERSMKYAILFFVPLPSWFSFLLKYSGNTGSSPLQYVLVGFGLSLFYLILLSLAEHLGFGISYILASAGIISLITSYSKAIFKSNRLSGIMAGFLVFVYGLLLFCFKCRIMPCWWEAWYCLCPGCGDVFTLKIDWYGGNGK
jgi:inner membrane protein